MEPYLTQYNYIRDYYQTVYDLYSKEYPKYPVSYYSTDWDNSTMDKKELMGGSYEKAGVGDVSGVKWKKIFLLPVGNIEQITPTQDASERGVDLDESKVSAITIPTTLGIQPFENDVVHFSQEFMMQSLDIDPLFVITNINRATYGDLSINQCQMRVAPFDRTMIEKQISSYHMFLEFTKSIHPIENSELLLKLQSRSETLSARSKESFSNVTGFYLTSLGV